MPSAADFNAIHADPKTADVTAVETTTSTTYTDLATAGPAATETLVAGQTCLVVISARAKHSTAAGSSAKFSFAVSGASTQAALDANSCETDQNTTAGHTCTRVTVFTATGTGSHTFTMKYKVVNSGTGTFNDRRIVVKKF